MFATGNRPGHNFNCRGLLSTNTTCLLQPIDQGIISTVVAYYLRRTFAHYDVDWILEELLTSGKLLEIFESWQEVNGCISEGCVEMSSAVDAVLKALASLERILALNMLIPSCQRMPGFAFTATHWHGSHRTGTTACVRWERRNCDWRRGVRLEENFVKGTRADVSKSGKC